jgi:large subunit ribosomal protein L3
MGDDFKMSMGLLGKKIGMTQVFDKQGNLIPVTLVEAGPCYVVQIKTRDKDGYTAVQLGFDNKRERAQRKPEIGHFKQSGTGPKRFVREFRVMEGDLEKFSLGQEVTVDLFKAGEKVVVTGTSKGRGFAGREGRGYRHLQRSWFCGYGKTF